MIQKMRLVGSMTTVPSRVDKLYKTIQTILDQTEPLDVLYINIPYKSRKGAQYPDPEDFDDRFDPNKYKTKIVVNRCKDHGPLTKLAPTLSLETNPETRILTFDDDLYIGPDVVSIHKQKLKEYPNACLCFSGVCAGSFPFVFQFVINNKKDTQVDWIQGVHVPVYKRSFFGTEQELVTFGDDTPLRDLLVWNDDHRISAYLESKNIPKISIDKPITDHFMFFPHHKDGLSGRILSLVSEHAKIINYYKKAGYYYRNYSKFFSIGMLVVYLALSTIFIWFGIKGTTITRLFLIIFNIYITGAILKFKYGLCG